MAEECEVPHSLDCHARSGTLTATARIFLRPRSGVIMLHRICLLLAGFLSMLVTTSPARAADADLILHNGKIVTVDRKFSIHQAIALRGDRILRVGTNEE